MILALRLEILKAHMPNFAHHSNLDGTIDIICMRCFALWLSVTRGGVPFTSLGQ
jgi:hypothetical protein